MTKVSPTIAYSFNSPLPFVGRLRAKLAEHPSAPHIIDMSNDGPAWGVPPEADFLICAFTGWDLAPAEKPAQWPHGLRHIHVLNAGVDKFPAWFFDDVPVTCGRGVSSVAIAEFVMAAVLGREKKLVELSRRGAGDPLPGIRGVAGKTIGLVGAGAIGRAVAERALSFGMTVLATTRSGRAPEGLEVEVVSIEDLMRRSDHVAICAPLTEATRGLFDARLLGLAKPDLHLINVARGEIVDQDALLAALNDGRLGFATLDVTVPDPLPAGHPLAGRPDTMITPHISWMAEDNFERLVAVTLDVVDCYARGVEPRDYLVSAEHRY